LDWIDGMDPKLLKEEMLAMVCKGEEIAFKELFLFNIREQRAFFEQKVWKYEKCSLNLQRSK
jgi:hypothetical protein